MRGRSAVAPLEAAGDVSSLGQEVNWMPDDPCNQSRAIAPDHEQSGTDRQHYIRTPVAGQLDLCDAPVG